MIKSVLFLGKLDSPPLPTAVVVVAVAAAPGFAPPLTPTLTAPPADKLLIAEYLGA